jgi:hypothetical protein
VIRFYLIAGAVALVAAGILWWHHTIVVETERAMKIAQQEAANEQAGKDAITSQETINGLKADLAELRRRELLPVTPSPLRLCYTPSAVPKVAPAHRAQPGPASAGSVPSVQPSDRAGPDPLPSLRQLAEGAEVVSAMDRACLRWARGIAK